MAPCDVRGLAQRKKQLCVAELGFGTGLNFAVCASEVLAHSDARLHFISFEKHPLRQDDWHTIVRQRAAELPIYRALSDQPLPVVAGWQRRLWADGRIMVSVFHGEVAEGLADLVTRQTNPVDAWFLDGFAPGKNPSMWTPQIYQQLARMAHADTTVATFSAAGHVRRGLQAAGFAMRRIDQQPHKRESLAGTFTGDTTREPKTAPVQVSIHGAGIGGACMARHLAEAQVAVGVFDPGGVAGGASSIDATVMHSRLLADGSADAELRGAAFHYASNFVRRFAGFSASGVLQTQGPNLDAAKLTRLNQAYDASNPDQHHWIQYLEAEQATRLAGTHINGDALLFPSAGVVDLPVLCASLLQHPLIEVVESRADLTSEHLNVICTGTGARQFPGCDWLEMVDVYGQVDWFTAPSLANLPVIGNGYLVPTGDGCALGATYEHTPWPVAEATTHNLDMNAHFVQQAGLQPADLLWQRRSRGARAVTSDRVPVIGEIQCGDDMAWIATGFGSMGTTLAPLAAAIVSSEISGWLAPVSARVQALIRPERFLERQARRGVRHILPG